MSLHFLNKLWGIKSVTERRGWSWNHKGSKCACLKWIIHGSSKSRELAIRLQRLSEVCKKRRQLRKEANKLWVFWVLRCLWNIQKIWGAQKSELKMDFWVISIWTIVKAEDKNGHIRGEHGPQQIQGARLPGGPVVKTLHCQSRALGFNPWLGN